MRPKGETRRWALAATVAASCALALALAAGWRASRADPVVRMAAIGLADWPRGAPAVRVALAADIHLGNASTDPRRLARVVALVNGARPDLVLIAGDLVAGYDPAAARREGPALRAALARLRAPLGVVAVLGNHDNESDPGAVARALQGAGATVTENAAVRRGPLVIGVSGDTVSGHARLGGALNGMRRLLAAGPGARLYLSHSPDIVRWLPPGPALLLAGHTHCGQIMLPLIGAPVAVSRVHGDRYRCGIVRNGNRTVVVTAGIGTSNLPLRWGAPPDLWLLTLGPAASPQP